jgi:hypothetical protein
MLPCLVVIGDVYSARNCPATLTDILQLFHQAVQKLQWMPWDHWKGREQTQVDVFPSQIRGRSVRDAKEKLVL